MKPNDKQSHQGPASRTKKTASAAGYDAARPELELSVVKLDAGRWQAICAGEPMEVRVEDAEARVLDLDLARVLGYEFPNEIRKLIRRMLSDRKLSDSEVIVTVTKTSIAGGRPATEYHLTRTAALLIATQSQTPRAWALTRLIVRVFEMVMDGEREAALLLRVREAYREESRAEMQRLVEGVEERYRKELADRDHRIALIEARVQNDGGTISPEFAAGILARIRKIAALRAKGNTKDPAYRRALRELHNRVRNRVQFNGRGKRWDRFPRNPDLLTVLHATLDEFEADALAALTDDARAAAAARAKQQMGLPGVDDPSKPN